MGAVARETDDLSAFGERLARRIRAEGPISVADYMEAVADFYYGTRDPFGAAGDFTTAPEVSQIFGELIGLWCVDLWRRMGAPDPVLLVELGPGRGTLMADALRAARIVPKFLEATQLHLVERSPVLRQMQAEKLDAFAPHWHDGIDTLPPGLAFFIANEFLDALPIRQFEHRQGGWHERLIGCDPLRMHFSFTCATQPSPLAATLPDAADGAIAELAPAITALGTALTARLRRDGGAALFIDYGYFPSAYGDTLQALRRHKPVPVLDAPGSADLTAHVDFAAFAAAAQAAGATVLGPVTQHAFLRRLGIAERAATLLAKAAPAQTEKILSGAQRLIDPPEMGSLFKVMALTPKGAPIPAGFDGEHP